MGHLQAQDGRLTMQHICLCQSFPPFSFRLGNMLLDFGHYRENEDKQVMTMFWTMSTPASAKRGSGVDISCSMVMKPKSKAMLANFTLGTVEQNVNAAWQPCTRDAPRHQLHCSRDGFPSTSKRSQRFAWTTTCATPTSSITRSNTCNINYQSITEATNRPRTTSQGTVCAFACMRYLRSRSFSTEGHNLCSTTTSAQ